MFKAWLFLLVVPVLAFGHFEDSLEEGDDELAKAPPSFSYQNGMAVFSDFSHVTLQLTFDVAAKTAKGVSVIEFTTKEKGYPLFDFVGNVSKAILNNEDVGSVATVSAPGSATSLRVINKEVASNATNRLELEFTIPSGEITFSTTGVKIGFFMSDVGEDRAFLEKYVPANLEFDQFPMDVSLSLKGGTPAGHNLFANGSVQHPTESDWFISYPSYFTTSSFYLHFTEAVLSVEREMFQGVKTQFPITVYASSSSSAKSGMTRAKQVLTELEDTYGPFTHQQVIAYIAGAGGMEHCGATMTSLSALGHELTHSYFARGVMPSSGNSGWMDEAIASWRDNNYPVGSTPSGQSVNLANASPYKRTTPMAAYTSGADFISDLDYLFKSKGGMKTALRELFTKYQRRTITTPLFAQEMEAFSGMDLDAYFDKFVYGKGFRAELGPAIPRIRHSLHPRAYTQEELVQFR